MRKLWINLLAPVLLLAATTVVSSQPPNPMRPQTAQPPNPMRPQTAPAKDNDKEAPAKSQLEQMLEIALKSNPDIRVADAKAREADAELSRTRMAVTRKVVVLYNSLETARANVNVAEKLAKRLRAMSGSGGVAAQDLDEAEAKLVQAKAELAKLEAEIPYLLGQQKLKWQKDADGKLHLVVEASADEKYRDVLDRIEAARLMQGGGTELRLETREPNKAMSDKLRTAFDQQVTVDIKADSEPSDILDFCRDRYGDGIDINIIVKDRGLKFAESHGALRLRDVPFGAVLQWIEDGLPKHCFVVRDYGLVLVPRDQIPDGALRVNEFWKSKPKGDKK